MGNKVDKEQKEVVFDKKEIFPEEISAIPSSVKAISLYHCKHALIQVKSMMESLIK